MAQPQQGVQQNAATQQFPAPGMADMMRVMQQMMESFDPLRNHKHGLPLAKFAGHWYPAFMPVYYPQIRNFPVQKEDIAVLSFPKSGTNWLHHMVYMIESGNYDGVAPPEHRQSLLELPKPPVPSSLERYAALPAPHIFASHLTPSLLPKDIFNGRVIYIYRNAKDTAVSYYYHHVAMSNVMNGFDETFEQFARRFMAGDVMAGPYPEHLKAYDEVKKQGKRILILRYEDAKKNHKAAIRQIAEFLGKQLDAEAVDKIAEASSFEKMRGNDALNWSDRKRAGVWKQDMEFMRKGQVGDWRSHFTDQQLLAEFEKFIADNLPAELIPPDN